MVREREAERLLVAGVRKLGGQAIKLAPTTNGVPDRLVLLPGGRAMLVELKSETGSLSPIQKHWQSVALKMGQDVRTLHGKDQVRVFLRSLEGENPST